ncbi:JM171 [macacine gammaherpesvirus 11]|uniref:JM171 n=2 Tax=macacine gammaherpesvirus 11 TaxID=2560570 RepID=G9JMZ8_9GAMA|nr:JM171 [Macaca fuscata rhadinovirus]AAT00148.1 JM171 [Macaca fuscata rhadinovirus]AEW87695.1 JM171 [Macaca fuscata rhadinovirus]AEW87865.1 JM171 [Macaca fuscata rhadinovirus]
MPGGRRPAWRSSAGLPSPTSPRKVVSAPPGGGLGPGAPRRGRPRGATEGPGRTGDRENARGGGGQRGTCACLWNTMACWPARLLGSLQACC